MLWFENEISFLFAANGLSFKVFDFEWGGDKKISPKFHTRSV